MLGGSVAEPMCWVGGWLDQVGIRLTQLSTGLKVEAELGNNLVENVKLGHCLKLLTLIVCIWFTEICQTKIVSIYTQEIEKL